MIHAVRFRSFKALRDVELELDRFTILVGPNASGKTSVLDGLHILSRLPSTDPRVVFDGRAGLGVIASRGAQGVLELGLSGTFRKKRGELSIAFTAIEDYPFSDGYRFESRWGDRRFSIRRELSPPEDGGDTHPGRELGLGLVLRDAANLRFDVDRLAEPAYSDLATPVVAADGRGLAAVVADMAVARPDDFARLQDAVRAIVPGLVRVRLVRVKIARRNADEPVWGHEIVLDMVGASDIPARAASEGTLRVLGLFAVLLGADRPDLVLVDQIEHGVTPGAYAELAAQIAAVLEADPELQIVATSCSPSFVDHHAAEAIRVHCLLEDGSVRVRPLTDHPEHGLLREDLRPGEFWLQVGDEWVADDPVDDDQETRRPPPVDTEPPTIETHPFPASMPPLPNGPARS